MPKKKHHLHAVPRRRMKVDTHKLSRALLDLAVADAERAAQAEYEAKTKRSAS